MYDRLANVQELILTELTDSPMTISELEHRLKMPYTTIQQAHKILREQGKIVKFDNRVRNARWIIGPNNGPRGTIPRVRVKGNNHKLTEFSGVHNIPEGAKEMAHNVIKAWTTIAMTAQRLNEGVPTGVLIKRLNRQKVNLHQARSAFEEVIFFINQLLEMPELWDIEKLSNFPMDETWDEFVPKLKEMYDYYYSQEPNDD